MKRMTKVQREQAVRDAAALRERIATTDYTDRRIAYSNPSDAKAADNIRLARLEKAIATNTPVWFLS